MKRKLFYTGLMLTAGLLFSSAYYISYQHTQDYYREKAKNNQISHPQETISTKPEISTPVDQVKENRITDKSQLILTITTLPDNTSETITRSVPIEWIGKNREELLLLLEDYTSHAPLDEIEKGLVSYQLQSFSTDKICAIKTYNPTQMPYKYFISVVNYQVVVYYCDKETVYEYTGIDARTLSYEEQEQLLNGYYVTNQEELYGILETYSS